jgi:hypothetical protein
MFLLSYQRNCFHCHPCAFRCSFHLRWRWLCWKTIDHNNATTLLTKLKASFFCSRCTRRIDSVLVVDDDHHVVRHTRYYAVASTFRTKWICAFLPVRGRAMSSYEIGFPCVFRFLMNFEGDFVIFAFFHLHRRQRHPLIFGQDVMILLRN